MVFNRQTKKGAIIPKQREDKEYEISEYMEIAASVNGIV
jgi:hypothetical protein